MHLYVGTSGYAYAPWKGKFYPSDMPAAQFLHYYGKYFNTVEINNTFFRMPAVSVLESWADQVPAKFKFSIKAPRQITHSERLLNSGEAVQKLIKVIAALKGRLGPILFQLPPNMKKDLPRLRDFLAILPPTCKAAFEFRHQSWMEQDVFDLLSEHNAALCIADADDELDVPFAATATWGYLRLRREKYPAAGLKKWAADVRKQKWADAFIYFKHEDKATGPAFAKQFLALV